MSRPLVIAIDGPSAVGKGTVSRRVAEALGYRHVDTGVMYRVVAWRACQLGVAFEAEEAVAEVARRVTIDTTGGTVVADGLDVTRAIRTPEVDRGASAVARLPRVRAVLVERQRAMGAAGGVVMEGRDIGTVVFPDADIKIFLEASAEERARRRAHDASHTGCHEAVATVAADLAARDRADRTRAASPLAVAADAVVVDTTALPIDAVVQEVLAVVQRRLAAGPAAD